MGVEWADLAGTDLLVLGVVFALAVGPYVSAYRDGTSLALATVLSLMLVAFVQFAYSILQGVPMQFSWIIDLFGIKPGVMGDPVESYRMLSAAWLHADWIHVLSNILVIALVGIPLEQRLGGHRWLAVYFLGFIGGNLAWVLSHPDSLNPAIGASGAAFGLLGAYMACWPEDKVEFPLLFFIRAWPVWLIVFVRLGLEVWQMYSLQSDTAGESDVAHMAHVGGFFLAYVLARPIARGAPSSLDAIDGAATQSQRTQALLSKAKQSMGSLDDDPWFAADKPLEGEAARVLLRLREEGDELETRRAWLEELSEHTICPVCDGEMKTEMRGENCRMCCVVSGSHVKWP